MVWALKISMKCFLCRSLFLFDQPKWNSLCKRMCEICFTPAFIFRNNLKFFPRFGIVCEFGACVCLFVCLNSVRWEIKSVRFKWEWWYRWVKNVLVKIHKDIAQTAWMREYFWVWRRFNALLVLIQKQLYDILYTFFCA